MIWKRINGVVDRPMSRAGKEVFLKAVIQAIPTFVFSCFQVPVANCDKMRATIANQWWGIEDGQKKLHWRSWEWLSTPKSFGGLGFRDLSLFNQAMLGRQGWRLLTEPTSLCARVLKGRYFPHSDFWHAPKPRTSSFTWRSILFGRELLRRGVQWGIGDGTSVKITSDFWISDRPPFLLRPLKPIPDIATVSCLIDEVTHSWIPETIHAFFDAATTELILQIPIDRHGGTDFVRWPFSKQGIYSVRSAYNFARSDKFFISRSLTGRGMHSGSMNEEKDWKALWKINAPGKMKIHLWRFAHDCLPSGEQMQRRNIPTSDLCIFCGRSENIAHSLLTCHFAREVWRLIKQAFNIKLGRGELMSSKTWLFSFLSQATEVEATVLAVVFWHIWEARNEARNNSATSTPSQTCAKSLAYVEMIIQNCYKKKPANQRRETRPVIKWSPPPRGEYLINVDAALFDDLKCMAMGMVVLDHSGVCKLVASERLQGFAGPEYAEAMALRRAVQIAKEKGFLRVSFLSDCLSLIQRLNHPGPDRSVIGLVVKDIRRLIDGFSSATFRHVPRSLNEPAHLLARNCDVSSLGFISDFAPDLIRETICNLVK
jgi:hypothetical protein